MPCLPRCDSYNYILSDTIEFPYCKRNIGTETHDQEENIQFIQEQCDKNKTMIDVGMYIIMICFQSFHITFLNLFNEQFLFVFY